MSKTHETKLAQYLWEHGIAQKTLAYGVGTTPQYVNKWCQGINEPSTFYWLKISKFLNEPIEKLIGKP